MGTRNLTIVKMNNEIKVAQYCQWDGYPMGQGRRIAYYLTQLDINKIRNNLKNVTWYSEEELTELYKKFETREGQLEIKEKYPELHRDTGSDILKLIEEGQITKLVNQIDFLQDNLFCEYAYEIDLDQETIALFHHGNNLYRTYKFSEFTEKAMKEVDFDKPNFFHWIENEETK